MKSRDDRGRDLPADHRRTGLSRHPGGIRAAFCRPHQLALPSRIWISWNGQWFISTWLPACYSVPPDVDIADLCQDCLRFPGNGFYWIPEAIVHRYGLRRMSDEEFDRLILIPPVQEEIEVPDVPK